MKLAVVIVGAVIGVVVALAWLLWYLTEPFREK